jgi:uncharacterized protein
MTATEPDQPAHDQDAILAFLAGQEPGCKRVDTHISIVFLGKDRVLKVKRAVQLPFLDFSTLEKRKHACEEELIVNRRFAPDLYRRIVPITQENNGLEIGGKGPAIEWAVEMTRFDENKTFDHLARAGHISTELAETLAMTIRTTHQRAEISDGSSWLASIAGIIDRNTQLFRNEAQLPRQLVDRLDADSKQRLADCRSLLQARASEGLVRRCHGDAHLGNITLIDGSPVLFDAIEFDPVIATTDILYDLAFPIMDFCRFSLTACANRLLNGYFQTAWRENARALRLLPLFLSMRAAIRSDVLFTKCRLSPDGDHDATDARAYFDLALRHLAPTKPSLIAIGGKSGTGKSVLARELAPLPSPLPGAILLRSDVIRKELFAVEPHVSLPPSAYTPEVTSRVYRTLFERSRQIVEQGFSVVVDAAFLTEAERNELSKTAKGINAKFHPVFLDAELDVRVNRIRSRKKDASDATAEIAAAQEDYDIGKIDWPIIDTSGTPEQTLERSNAVLVPR